MQSKLLNIKLIFIQSTQILVDLSEINISDISNNFVLPS